MEVVEKPTPESDVPVQGKPAQASPFGPQITGPVESKKEFFKYKCLSVTCGPGSTPGEVLGVVELDYRHGELLADRVKDYKLATYDDVKLQGKRTDHTFLRNGAMGVFAVDNPYVTLSESEFETNFNAVMHNPDTKIVAISDPIDYDATKIVKRNRVRAAHYLNFTKDMPLDYLSAGRIFIICINPPVITDFTMDLYLTGNVIVSGYFPLIMDSRYITFKEEFLFHEEPELEWDNGSSAYQLVFIENIDESRTFYGKVIRVVTQEWQAFRVYSDSSNYKEIHHLKTTLGTVAAYGGKLVARFHVPTVLASTRFSVPKYDSGIQLPMRVYMMVSSHSEERNITFKGRPLDTYPNGSPNCTLEELEKNMNAQQYRCLVSQATGEPYEPRTKPADPVNTSIALQ